MMDKRPSMTAEEYLRKRSRLDLDIDVTDSTIKQLKYKRQILDLENKKSASKENPNG